jgi:hypothetical protein
MRKTENAYKILVGKTEGKRPLGRHKLTWENNTRIDPGELEWEIIDWITLIHNRLPVVSSCEHGNEPSDSIKGGNLLTGDY